MYIDAHLHVHYCTFLDMRYRERERERERDVLCTIFHTLAWPVVVNLLLFPSLRCEKTWMTLWVTPVHGGEASQSVEDRVAFLESHGVKTWVSSNRAGANIGLVQFVRRMPMVYQRIKACLTPTLDFRFARFFSAISHNFRRGSWSEDPL